MKLVVYFTPQHNISIKNMSRERRFLTVGQSREMVSWLWKAFSRSNIYGWRELKWKSVVGMTLSDSGMPRAGYCNWTTECGGAYV